MFQPGPPHSCFRASEAAGLQEPTGPLTVARDVPTPSLKSALGGCVCVLWGAYCLNSASCFLVTPLDFRKSLQMSILNPPFAVVWAHFLCNRLLPPNRSPLAWMLLNCLAPAFLSEPIRKHPASGSWYLMLFKALLHSIPLRIAL